MIRSPFSERSFVLIFCLVHCLNDLNDLTAGTNLSKSFLLQLPCDAVIDQILDLEFGELCLGLGQKLQGALYPLFGRNNAAIVKHPYSVVQVFAAVRRSEPQPLPQTADDCWLIALILNESVRPDQRPESFLHCVRRAVDETSG